MKTAKQQKVKGKKASIQRNINKSLSDGKKYLKSSGGQCHKNTGPGTSSKVPSNIKQEEEQMLHPSAKIKLQLFPLDQRIREGLETVKQLNAFLLDGHNPFLELTLKARKKISSVIEHLGNKWGSSSIAVGELMLFPFAVVDNLTSYKGWASCETGISAGDVHAAIGSPDNFRLRYGWVSTQPNSSTSTPSLGCADPGQLERVLCSTMETTVGSKIHTEVKSKESEPHHQTEVKNEDFKPRKTSKMEDDTTVVEKTSAESFKYEEPRMQNDLSFLWSDWRPSI